MLDASQVKKIAKLARLKLTEAEIEKYAHDLSAILEHAEQLNEIDTSNVKPLFQVTGIENRTREDEVIHSNSTDAILSRSPNPIEDHQYSVKNVL